MRHSIAFVRNLPRVLAALGLALLMSALLVRLATAHGADLLGADPFPGAVLETLPDNVRTWFSLGLDAEKSLLQVFDAEARQVDSRDGGVDLNDPDHLSMIVSLPPLPDGKYTVRWYAVVTDGDATEGLFHFTVGDPAMASSQVIFPDPIPVDGADGSSLPLYGMAAFVGVLVIGTFVVVLRLRATRGG